MSARCETCGRFCPTDTHSVKLHGRKCQEADTKLRSFTATAITRWSREDADKFFAALEARLPKPQVRQCGLTIELGGTQPMTVGLPDGRSFTGKGWSKIGTARSSHTQRQLRKFVKRGGKFVEVRARGRTGSRELQEAVLQAGVEGCFGNEFTVEGTYD